MLELQRPDKISLHRVKPEAIEHLKQVLNDHKLLEESQGSAKDDPGQDEPVTCRLQDCPWSCSGLDDTSCRGKNGQELLGKMLLAFNSQEFNVYAKVSLAVGTPEQRICVILRHSNIAYSEALTLQPKGEATISLRKRKSFDFISTSRSEHAYR